MTRIARFIILNFALVSAAAAQEAVPETPPELRDFRLDPERAQPQPQPPPPAEVVPPPAARTVEPAPQPAAPRADRPAPVRETPRQQADANQAERDDAQTAPEAEPAAEPAAEAISQSPTNAAPVARVPVAPEEPSAIPWLEILAALAAAILLLTGWLFFRRRRANDRTDTGAALPIPQSFAPAPSLTPQPISLPPQVIPIAKRPQILLEFVPDRAVLGFSALTLKGQLRLVNTGGAPAGDMQLRVTMISANGRQTETIAAFHGGAIPVTPNPIGGMLPGERLALDIEMAVQVAEIDSYTVGGKKIFVPVMLANLAYSWDGGSDNVTLACMVGRESDPPKPRMGPFRLDLGPRSFSPLGQRPLTA